MPRLIMFAVGVGLLAHAVRAEDSIAPETVEAVKKATVFIRIEGDGWAASGSGFVVAADDKAVLIATNHHVATASGTPAPKAGVKPPPITVVFDSGTKTERTYTAEIAAADAERDLAVLRVAGVKDAPKPIAYSESPKLVETMQVYSFGFPFGKALATGKGFPAVTVGKASISSLRNGSDGELEVVQIDGNLNPGNSGGPVVDVKGRLVGVAVATIRDGQGIGLTVPSAELVKMMQGRVGRVRVIPKKAGDGPVTVRVEAELIDPVNKLRAPTAHYFVVAPKTKRPDAEALDKLAGSKKLDLKIEKGVAFAEFTVDKAEGEVLVQVKADAEAGKPALATRVRAYPLAPLVSDVTGTPPAGWKEYSPRDKAFVVWVPEKPQRQADQQRTSVVKGQRLRVDSLIGKTSAGLVYQAESIVLPLAFAKAARNEMHDLFRDAIVSESKGRVKDSVEVQMGNLTGTEYTIDAGSSVTRARIFVIGARVHIVQVTGTAEQVAGTEGDTILSSFHLPAPSVAKGPNEGPLPKEVGVGKELTFVGGRLDPAFKDVGPQGALLVGLEVVIGKPIRDELIQSLRPIYRVGDKESFGTQFGTDTKNAVTIKAKPGYAIGALSAKARNVCDGFSVTFMKVVDGKLDPKDSYESDWIGWNGTFRVTKVGGDGTPAVGVAVKVGAIPRGNPKDVTGLGLVFKGQEDFEANAVKPNLLPRGKDPTILGGAFDPQFKDMAPEGGHLIGFEIGLGKFINWDVIRSVRPIYRAGDKETFGEQRGTKVTNPITIKAKEGYAVGAVTVKHGLGFDGMSVTFMKVVDGKLDPKDSYESAWIGTDEKKIPSKIDGEGTLVIGIVGKSNAKDMTGMGLLFKGQEAFDPKKK
jgi:S1-C subfamily serine protease